MILVANKVDLSQRRKVSEEAGQRMANKLGMNYIETSAKEPPQNIDEAFRQVTPTNISAFYYIPFLNQIFSEPFFLPLL